MKKILLSALVAASFSASAQTNYPGGISGCIARWDFAQSPGPVSALPDVSGNGNNASSVNNLTSTLGFRNVANKSMVFNGFNSSATIPHTSMLQPTAMTMVALVRFNSFYNGNCQGNFIISKGDNHTSGHYSLVVSDNIYDQSCSIISPFNKQFYSLYGIPNLTNQVPPGNYLTTGQWYLFVSSYDGTTMRHYQVAMDPNNYVSGITPFTTATVSGSIGSNTNNVLLGMHGLAGYPYNFSGLMEEVALFNRVLTNAEVQQVYDYLWGIVAVSSVPTNLCIGQPFNVAYTVNNTSFFSSTNTFTVQLSDASGSFVSPTNIGSTTSTTGGTINCTIPASTPDGSGYRIRIVGTAVAYTGRDNGTNLTVTNITKPSITSNSPVCAGQTLTLSGSSSTTGVTYNWNGPFSFTSNQQSISIPNITTASGGNYTLYATKNGCTSLIDTETVVIGSNVPPLVTSYASPGDTICIGGTAAFYALVTAGANPQYQWMKNGQPIVGETSATYVTKTLMNGDVIHCQVTSSGCATTITTNSNSHTIAIVGKSPAGVSISASPGLTVSPWTTVTFTANTTNGGLTPTYQWKLNGNDILGATGQTWSANNLANNDAVSVVIKSSSDCAEPANATSQAVVMSINTSVGDLNNTGNIKLYPNPSQGAFTLDHASLKADAAYEVINAIGQVVAKGTCVASTQTTQVNMEFIPAGIYIVKITSGDTTGLIKLLIEK